MLPTFIKLPFVFKAFVLSIFEWSLKTGFTVLYLCNFVNKFEIKYAMLCKKHLQLEKDLANTKSVYHP